MVINSLLVAVDGSNHSLKAVEVAAEIAAACKAQLTIMTVIKPHQAPKLSAELRAYAKLEHIGQADIGAIRLLSDSLLTHCKKKAIEKGATKVDTNVETGPIARTIVSYAKRKKVDVIVIGSRGLGNIEATLRGGISHRVELLSECSVLTVK